MLRVQASAVTNNNLEHHTSSLGPNLPVHLGDTPPSSAQDDAQVQASASSATNNGPEDHTSSLGRPPWTAVTLFRVLCTAAIIGPGIAKAVSASQNRNNSVGTFDWIIGIVIALAMYWGAVLEAVDPPIWSPFFHTDYLPEIISMFTLCFIRRFALSFCIIFLHGVFFPTICFCIISTSIWFMFRPRASLDYAEDWPVLVDISMSWRAWAMMGTRSITSAICVVTTRVTPLGWMVSFVSRVIKKRVFSGMNVNVTEDSAPTEIFGTLLPKPTSGHESLADAAAFYSVVIFTLIALEFSLRLSHTIGAMIFTAWLSSVFTMMWALVGFTFLAYINLNTSSSALHRRPGVRTDDINALGCSFQLHGFTIYARGLLYLYNM